MLPVYILYRAEVNEQIAVALVRLQQDMQSVLTRLSTLEALSVAQTRVRSRTPSENERDRQVCNFKVCKGHSRRHKTSPTHGDRS